MPNKNALSATLYVLLQTLRIVLLELQFSKIQIVHHGQHSWACWDPTNKTYPAKKIQIVLMCILRHKFIPTN